MNTRPTAEIDLQRLTKRPGAVSHAQRFRLGSKRSEGVFAFHQVGVTPDGRAVGYHTATGLQSIFKQQFLSNGVQPPDSMFTPTAQPPTEKLY